MMKQMMIALTALLTIAAGGHAMSYEQARNEALFLTDKMAYELNLTDEQYEAAYEINLDYLMGVTSYDDVYGTYWERRNLDLSYILLDWQLSAFRAATYFYRPLYWSDGFWHFAIYARYPHRDYFYFGRPVFYASYRGGHAWHHNGGRSWYHGHRDHYIHHGHSTHVGMRDGWNRGDYRHHQFNSSTHSTVNHHNWNNRGGRDGNRHDWNNRGRGHNNGDGTNGHGNRGGGNHGGGNHDGGNHGSGNHGGTDNGTTGNNHNNNNNTLGGRTYGGGNHNGGRTYGGGNNGGRTYGGSITGGSTPRNNGGSFSSGRSGGSFSGGHSGGSSHSGGGRSSGGGHSYGGRR